MVKKHIYIILGVFLLISTTSCEDFLKEKHETEFTAATLFETVEGLEKMVAGLHNHERGLASLPGDGNGLLASNIWGERTTDLVVFTTGGDASLGRYSDAGANGAADKGYYNKFWEHKYYTIGRANEIIHYGKLLGDDAKTVMAHGSFWRAYAYYNLWIRFGAVYLNTEPITPETVFELSYKKADPVDLFKLLNADLDAAIADLPEENPKNGHLFKNTARHLKALVAAWEKDWTGVLKMVADIEASGQNQLATDNASLFDASILVDKPETLMAIAFSEDRGGGAKHRLGDQTVNVSYILPYTVITEAGTEDVPFNTENLGSTWGLAFPNSYLLSLYSDGDKRLTAYFKIKYHHRNKTLLNATPLTVPIQELKTDPVTGRTYYTTTNDTGVPKQIQVGDVISGRDLLGAGKGRPAFREITPSSTKLYDHWGKPLNARGALQTNDIIIFRLSETYLLGAEAAMESSDQGKAAEYYNKTWVRAGNVPVLAVTSDMIRDEYARELNFEGRRWDFLQRHEIWFSQIKQYGGDFTKYPEATFTIFDPSTYGISDGRDPLFGPNPDFYADFNGTDNDVLVRFNVKEFHSKWAIPQAQREIMGADFPQNDGY